MTRLVVRQRTGVPAIHVRATPLANFTLATVSPRAVARSS